MKQVLICFILACSALGNIAHAAGECLFPEEFKTAMGAYEKGKFDPLSVFLIKQRDCLLEKAQDGDSVARAKDQKSAARAAADLGNIELLRHEFKRAEYYFTEALDLDPNNSKYQGYLFEAKKGIKK